MARRRGRRLSRGGSARPRSPRASTTRTTCCRRCSGSAPATARATRCAGARRPSEILLVDWIPRKIVADVEHLTRAPDLLRAFIRFCHHERGIRPGLTEDTVAAVDEFEPEYQQLIRSDRLQGPEALLAAMGVYDPEGADPEADVYRWAAR